MTPATLLILWFANWAVVSAAVIFFAKSAPSTQGGMRLDLWGLQENLPALAGWLLLSWPVALFRLLPAVFPWPRQPR
ncbi:hypothetical protein ACF087_34830 [Streptomyces goshikiensis]|uniref:hypothetical protein n=1 Tax=Streptomyces goshikiensis TaxID=1942 RepID=UPI0036F6CAE5